MVKPVTILVTGFGPFDGVSPGNLSYSIVMTLPTFLPPTPSCQTPIRIVVHPYDLPVSYHEIHTLVPRLYDAYDQDVDIWLHLGVRVKQDSYSIEQLARRDGHHEHRDITGESFSENDVQKFFEGCPAELETALDVNDVFARWRHKLLDSPEASQEMAGVMIRKSKDPGHFMCDFLYYSSLVEHWKRKKDLVDGDRFPIKMPVLFMNVPAKNTQEQLRKARHVTINLLRALAESYKQQKESKDAAPKA